MAHSAELRKYRPPRGTCLKQAQRDETKAKTKNQKEEAKTTDFLCPLGAIFDSPESRGPRRHVAEGGVGHRRLHGAEAALAERRVHREAALGLLVAPSFRARKRASSAELLRVGWKNKSLAWPARGMNGVLGGCGAGFGRGGRIAVWFSSKFEGVGFWWSFCFFLGAGISLLGLVDWLGWPNRLEGVVVFWGGKPPCIHIPT